MGPEHALAAIMVLGLVVYVLGGGADFGGGVWDLLARGPRRAEQRALVEHAIGPIWEANHVWFVFVFVILFSAFPPAFADITTALFGPLSFYAVGIVLRGSAFTFRHYTGPGLHKRTFGVVFSVVSVGCPWLLGAMGACLLRPGALRADVDPFVVASGLFVVALVAALAATYLTVEAGEDESLREDFRIRAVGALVVAGALSWVAVLAARASAPSLFAHLAVRGAAAVTTLLGLGGLVAVAKRRFRLARVLVAGLAASVVVSWAASKGETLASPAFTMSTSKAHPGTLIVLLVATGIGFVVLGPSLLLLFSIFGGARRER